MVPESGAQFPVVQFSRPVTVAMDCSSWVRAAGALARSMTVLEAAPILRVMVRAGAESPESV